MISPGPQALRVFYPPQQLAKRVAGAAIMIDRCAIDSRQRPVGDAQPRRHFQFLAAMQVAVGAVADGCDCGTPIEPAPAQPRHWPRPPIGIEAAHTLGIFQIVGSWSMTAPPTPPSVGLSSSARIPAATKGRRKPHVAVHQADEFTAAILEAELRTGAAGTVLRHCRAGQS